MEIKPRIFIGSSYEGIETARFVKQQLIADGFADVDVWDESGIFEMNKGYLETLDHLLNLYEYGIMIATADDKSISKKKAYKTVRDNVLFEFGLFMGRLGRGRAFYLVEKGSKIPSDLSGIKLPSFPARDDAEYITKLTVQCEEIKNHIRQKDKVFDGSIYPAVPLAYGYFYNFVEPACKNIINGLTTKINGEKVEIKSFMFIIEVPDDLQDDMKKKVEVKRAVAKWGQIEVESGFTRPYGFYVDISTSNEGHYEIYDVPTTLNSLKQAITEFLNIAQIGISLHEQIVENREIKRFIRVLTHLISKSSYTKKNAVIRLVDI